MKLLGGLLIAQSLLAGCGQSTDSEAAFVPAEASNSSVGAPTGSRSAGSSSAAIPTGSGTDAVAGTAGAGSNPSATAGTVPGGSSGAGGIGSPGGGEDVAVGGSGGSTPPAAMGGGGSTNAGGQGGVGGVGGNLSNGGAAGRSDGGTAGVRAVAGAGGGGNSVTETVHYYGRWNLLLDRAITVNSGSHVVAQFSGSEIRARFDVSLNQAPTPTLTWRIDEGEWEEGELAETLTLATNLPDGPHEVTLMVRGLNENQSRWNPPLVSSITFLAFDVPDGGELQPSVRPERPKLEFLGDSITEGVALWSSRNGQTTPCWRTDGRRNYASLTAQALNTEWRQVGFGRQGLLIDGNGGVPPANEAFNFIYADVPRDEWQPDWVVINQGTNDGGAGADDFRNAYSMFITTIRSAYPEAKIVAMRPFNGAHAAEISAEVDTRRGAGDERVFYVDTSGWLSSGDYTDGLHPNAQGSQKAAESLTTAIEALGFPSPSTPP